jgi:hypothetical protein
MSRALAVSTRHEHDGKNVDMKPDMVCVHKLYMKRGSIPRHARKRCKCLDECERHWTENNLATKALHDMTGRQCDNEMTDPCQSTSSISPVVTNESLLICYTHKINHACRQVTRRNCVEFG